MKKEAKKTIGKEEVMQEGYEARRMIGQNIDRSLSGQEDIRLGGHHASRTSFLENALSQPTIGHSKGLASRWLNI